MRRPNPRARNQQKRLLYALVALFPFLAGCGLGWLYMRVADSQRIKAMKLLTFDSSRDRFGNAKHLYEKAIDNYRESIMYDDAGNLMVYHKLGYTILMLPEPNLTAADQEFRVGLRHKRQKAGEATQPAGGGGGAPPPPPPPPSEKPIGGGGFRKDKQDVSETAAASAKPALATDPFAAARSDEEIQVDNELAVAENMTDSKKKDEDRALMYSGLGLIHFLRGIQYKKSEEHTLAAKYFKLADKWSTHPAWQRKQTTLSKLLANFDLEEIVDATPHMVLLARVHNYQAMRYLEQGQAVLADSELTKASDALDAVRIFYEKEPRYLTELANHHFLRKEYDKCLSTLKSIQGTQGYADLKVTNTLKARAMIEIARQKSGVEGKKLIEETQTIVNDLLDREPEDHKALLLRAACYAYGTDRNYTELKSTIDQVFANPKATENPQLLMDAGEIYASMNEEDAKKQAKNYYQKAFYITPREIRVNYLLGKAYHALGDTGNMKECFGRVCKIDANSSFCKEVEPLISSP